MRDLSGLATIAKVLLYGQAALSAAAVLLAISYGPGFAAMDGSDGYALIAVLQLLVLITGGIAVLRWIYLANANAHALGAQGMSTTPGWAVGYYFIPIANLFLPFQAMREVWKASTHPSDWELLSPPWIIGWWWFCWIASNVLSSIGVRFGMGEGLMADPGPLSEQLTTLADLLMVPASILLAIIIGDITSKQSAAEPGAIFS